MGEKLYKLMHNFLAPAKAASKEIVDVMIEQLKLLIIAKHFKFRKTNQASMETVSQYKAELNN